MQEECRQCVYSKQIRRIPPDAAPEAAAEYRHILDTTLADDSITAPECSRIFSRARKRLFGMPEADFTEVKRHFNALMLSLESAITQQIRSSEDPLLRAMQCALAANYIDFSALERVEEESLIDLIDHAAGIALADNAYDKLRAELDTARELVYLTDNCGEIVADKLLIAELLRAYPHLHITVIVRGAHAGNDATMEDAEQVGLTGLCDVYGSGSDIAGTVLRLLSPEARRMMLGAGVIFAKGQANYETLSGCGLNIYYLFMCKCHFFTEKFQVPQFSGMLVRECDEAGR